MMEYWVNPSMIQRMSGSLLHFFWQGALLALFAAVSLRLLARRTAETRYIVCVISLLLMLAAPVLTFMFYAETGSITQRIIRFVGETFQETGPAALHAAETAAWSQWIVLIWLAGVAVCALRLFVSWRLSQRLRNSAMAAVPAAVEVLFERIREQLARGKRVALLLSEYVDAPVVVGWLRPVVLLPLSAITGLREEQLLAVFAHELAHVRRNDFLVNIVQSCVESILFYHPAVWWLSARIRAERENCCDDLALQVCGDRLLYAQALIELERTRTTAPALALAATGSALTLRIRRILGRETVSRDWQSAVAALAFVLAWILAGVWQSSLLDASALTPPIFRPAAIFPIPAPPSASIAGAAEAIEAIVTAAPVPAEPQDPRGSIQGIVTKAGTLDPIANVQITLEAPADTPKPLATKPNGPQSIEDLFAALTPLGISRTNMPQAAPLPEDRVMSNINANAPASGVAVLNPDLLSALRKFRASTSQFKSVTDATGRFSLVDLPPGPYTIRAERESYFGSRADGSGAPVELHPVTVAERQKVNVALSLTPGATLVGRVSDGNRQPVVGAFVQAYGVTYLDGVPRLDAAGYGTTDDRGEYRVFWLPGGDYFVSVSTQPPGGTNAARPVLPPVARVTTTDAPPARTYLPGTIDLSRAVAVSLKPGGTLDTGAFVLQSAKPFTISGVINSTVPPARNATTVQAVLHLAPRDSGLSEPIRQVGNSILNPTQGQFQVANVLPGSYDVYARVPSALGGNAWGHVAVDVVDKDVAGLVLAIAPTVPVAGAIRMNGGAVPGSGLQLQLVAEGVFAKLVDLNVRMGAQRVFRPEPDGSFNITNVPPARYRLDVQGLPPTQYVSDVRQGGSSVFDSGFDVGRETPNALEVVLSEGAGSATGMVRDTSGKALANATVVAIPLSSRRLNWTLYRKAPSDSSGRFTIPGIAPGEYKLFAWESAPEGAYFDPKFIEKYETRGVPVRVSQAGSASSDLTALAPGR